MKKILAFLLAAGVIACIALGSDEESFSVAFKPFKGSYWLYSGTLDDRHPPTKNERKIAISIEGKAAKEMFDSMYPDAKSPCSDEKGHRERSKGNIYCAYNPREGYSCSVGFNLRTGESIEGIVC